jgi:hypothetical protein
LTGWRAKVYAEVKPEALLRVTIKTPAGALPGRYARLPRKAFGVRKGLTRYTFYAAALRRHKQDKAESPVLGIPGTGVPKMRPEKQIFSLIDDFSKEFYSTCNGCFNESTDNLFLRAV